MEVLGNDGSCMRRARLEGRHIGRRPLELDRDAIHCNHPRGLSLSLRQIAKAPRIALTRPDAP